MRKLWSTIAVIGVCGLSHPAISQNTGSSGATAATVQLSAGSTVKASASVAPSQGSAPAAYDNTNGATGVANTWLLIGGLTSAYDLLNIGAATTEAKSSSGALTSTMGTTTLTNVSSTLETVTALFTSIGLGIAADAITSTSTAGIAANGALYSSGSTGLTNLSLTGGIVNGLNLDMGLLANAAPNTVVLSLAGLKLTLNEQIVQNSLNSIVQQTNAVHLSFNQYAYDGGLLSGDVVLGHSQAQISAVPEPAAWISMILGFGAIGWALRRRSEERARRTIVG